MLIGPEKIVRRIVFFNKIQDGRRIPCYSRVWTASPICSKEATYPGRMLITFWCDSDITFVRSLHTKIGDGTVFLYN